MASLLTLAAVILAVPAQARNCVNITVPVDISATQNTYNVSAPRTQVDITTFVQNIVEMGPKYAKSITNGTKTFSGTYNISAQYCKPNNATNTTSNPFLQVLVHGSGYDKTYWDIAYNDYNYSYVNAALAAGYSVFNMDRLGIGLSSHGDPINEIQTPLELEALAEVTRKLRNGSIPEIGHAFNDRIAHVGHSAGSGLTFAMSKMYPNLTSGIVLTGFALNSSFGNLFTIGAGLQDAAMNQPLRLGDVDVQKLETVLRYDYTPIDDLVAPLSLTLDNIPTPLNYTPGYMVWNTAANQQAIFAHAPDFDPALLTFTENLKQPFTYGEQLSSASPANMTFDGPVLVFTGENDLPFCGGNCYNTGGALPAIPADVASAYGGLNSSQFEYYIQPASGHGLTLHLNATAGYNVIQSFFKKHNLQ